MQNFFPTFYYHRISHSLQNLVKSWTSSEHLSWAFSLIILGIKIYFWHAWDAAHMTQQTHFSGSILPGQVPSRQQRKAEDTVFGPWLVESMNAQGLLYSQKLYMDFLFKGQLYHISAANYHPSQANLCSYQPAQFYRVDLNNVKFLHLKHINDKSYEK